jgi:hypothetical protein
MVGRPQRTFDLPDAAVGEVLLAARYLTGLNLRDASALTGIDWHVLSRIERGERPCRVTELISLAGTYRFAPDRLVRAIVGDDKVRARLRLDEPE